MHPKFGTTVLPSDYSDLNATGPLYVGTCGDIKVRFYNEEDVTFKNYPVGDFPYIVKKLYSTGTTASDFIMTSLDNI